MRFEQLTLTEICKVGLSKIDIAGNRLGLSYLKNLRTDGAWLQPCPIETTVKLSACTPFTVGLFDYYIKSDGVYKQGTGKIYSYTFVGRVKIINLIKVVWIQDDVLTLYVDSTGVYTTNPSGNTTPIANCMTSMNGQIIAGGILTSSILGHEGLDAGYIAWTGIGVDNFSLTKQNESGIVHPDVGTVYEVLPLHAIDSFLVLGSRGATMMFYVEHIFGFKPIDIPLIKAEGLAASSHDTAVYIAQNGDIWRVKRDGSPEPLGYGWIGKDVTDVKYLKGRNIFVFTTSSNSFILDNLGMYSYGYKVWGEFNGALVVDTTFEQTTWEFRTTFWDAERSGLKNLMEVYVRDGLSTQTRNIKVYSETLSTTGGDKVLNTVDAVKYIQSGQNIAIEYRSAYAPVISSIHAQIIPLDRRFGNASLLYQNKW